MLNMTQTENLRMTPRENVRVASTDHAIAVARWDDDGGAPRHSPSGVDAAHDEHRVRSQNQPRHVQEEKLMKFRPLHDRFVVKRVEAEEKTAGGIIISDSAKEKPSKGEVISVGPGRRDEAGKLIPLDVKVGDRVLFGKWSGTEATLDGVEYLIMKESDIMGVLADVQVREKAA